jgi:hypothetical protein
MKTLFLIISIILSALAFEVNADNGKLILIRELYYKSSENKAYDEVFLKSIKTTEGLNASILKGYEGMSWMIRANHAINPYNKLKYFFKGKDMLETAIAENQESIELRFLRFGVQTNAPIFLNYSSEVNEDKAHILKNFSKVKDMDLRRRISDYMLSSIYSSKKEKSQFAL